MLKTLDTVEYFFDVGMQGTMFVWTDLLCIYSNILSILYVEQCKYWKALQHMVVAAEYDLKRVVNSTRKRIRA